MAGVVDELKALGGGLLKAVTGRQAYRLEVLGAPSAAGLSVVSFEATERLGEPYSVNVRLTHPMALDRMQRHGLEGHQFAFKTRRQYPEHHSHGRARASL
ncbi:hypothetical protein EPAKOI_001198 [Cupriavidus sp. H18C2]